MGKCVKCGHDVFATVTLEGKSYCWRCFPTQHTTWQPGDPVEKATPEDLCRGPAEEAFLHVVREAAKEGCGYGWMQQLIECEWRQKDERGAWGPIYFERRIAELQQQLRDDGDDGG